MLNIYSIKELLHKHSEIQWNITGTLPGKLKGKTFWALSYKILPPEITKIQEIAILEGTLGVNVEFNVFYDFLNFCLYLLVKNSFNFKLGFFNYFEYISGVSSEKNILHTDYHSARWYWCKKDQKNLPQISHRFFSQCLIVNSSLLCAFMVQKFYKNSFSGGWVGWGGEAKSKKSGIPVKKTCFLSKNPLELQVSMS